MQYLLPFKIYQQLYQVRNRYESFNSFSKGTYFNEKIDLEMYTSFGLFESESLFLRRNIHCSLSQLHLFALGPHARTMCNPKRPNVVCSKLSDYDDLCARVSERYHLSGFYRAFMSSSTQWLGNLFAGICINAQIVNMQVSCSIG